MANSSKYRLIFNHNDPKDLGSKESQYSWATPGQQPSSNQQSPPGSGILNNIDKARRGLGQAYDFVADPLKGGYQMPSLTFNQWQALGMKESEWLNLPGNEQATRVDYQNAREEAMASASKFQDKPSWLTRMLMPAWLRNLLTNFLTRR